MHLRSSPVLFALLTTLSFACSESSTSSSDPADGGTSTDGGADATTCTGEGKLDIRIASVPSGATAKVTVTGPAGARVVEAAGELTLPSGDYTVTADDLAPADPIVRTVHRATVSTATSKVCSETSATVEITYAPVGSSGKVWASNANGSAEVVGYASSVLAATGTQAASVAAETQGGKGIAFDKDGNLWAIGSTTVDPTLVRYPASSLGASGKKTPDRKIDIKGSGCSPSAHALAFDGTGNLWVSSLCEKKVIRLAASELGADAEITPTVAIGGLTAPKGIAFDAAGNLWVSDAVVRRYDAARLASSSDAAADATLTVAEDSEWLAFDAAGDLWSVGGSQINLLRVAKSDLAAAGARDVAAAVTLSVGVAALPEGIAFDEGGGLWIATSAGKFSRLAPEQLGTSTTYAAPTVPERTITSADVGSAGSFALYPAPAALPLFARIP